MKKSRFLLKFFIGTGRKKFLKLIEKENIIPFSTVLSGTKKWYLRFGFAIFQRYGYHME